MISADDGASKPAQMQITLTEQDIRDLKSFANREYLQSAQPRELDGPEFLVLCYARATDRILNQKGLNINIVFAAKLPYETID